MAAVLGRHAIALAADRIGWRSVASWLAAPGLTGAMRFRVLLEDLGGTFVKFGQLLAVQPDLVPPGYATHLLDLLDRVAPVPVEIVTQTLAAELGPSANLLEAMDPEPLATASIAQVHVARFGDRTVAVKVQRPGVERQFRGDLRMMLFMLRVIRLFHVRPLYWLEEPVREFAAWTDEELDFRREARYMSLVRRQSAGRAGIRIPEVVKQLTTRRVLVTEYLDGVPVATYCRAVVSNDRVLLDRLRRDGFVPAVFARQVISNFTTDSFHHGLFHADPHPANLLILPDNVVGYVDFGIVASIGPYARGWIAAMTLALARRDLDDVSRSFLKVAIPRADASPTAFRAGLEAAADRWYGGPGGTKLRKPLTTVMTELLELSRRTAVLPERDTVRYLRSIVTLDGVLHHVAPQLDLDQMIERLAATLQNESNRDLLFAGWAAALRAVESGRSFAARGDSASGVRRRQALAAAAPLQLGAAAFVCALSLARAAIPFHAGFNIATTEVAVGAAALLGVAIEIARPSR